MKKVYLLFVTLLNISNAFSQHAARNGEFDLPQFRETVHILPQRIKDRVDISGMMKDNSGVFKIPETNTGQLFDSANPVNRPYALIAGGSKGIGHAIAEALARRGYNLILVARHLDSLLSAKNKLESSYQVQVHILVHDLSKEESTDAIVKWCIARNTPLKMLCNVAGIGGVGDFLSIPPDSLRYMVRLNIESAMSLTLGLLPLLERNAPSYVLNVASMAGFAPIPAKNLYSATKSAVIFFSYSLRYQLKKKNISVSCLAPGPVFTKPSIKKDTKEKLGWIGMKMAVSPARVGEIAVRETINRKMIIVPGTLAKFASVLIRFFPKRWVVAIYDKAG